MTFASLPPPFVVFDPLLCLEQECWSCSCPHSEWGAEADPADQELCDLGQLLSPSQVVYGDVVPAGQN